jgi:hypothetical protein
LRTLNVTFRARKRQDGRGLLSAADLDLLRENFLSEFPFHAQAELSASLYDLCCVMFPDNFVMLKKRLRCVASRKSRS